PLRRAAESRNGLPLSGAPSSRKTRLAQSRVGRQRSEPAGQVLPADGGPQGTAVARTKPLVAARPCDRPRHERSIEQGIGNGVMGHDEFDDEIRGHMAISIKQRIERGEDPEAARLAALKEFGNLTLTRESMRGVWRPHWIENAEALWHDVRVALRSLRRVKGLAATVVV